MSLADDGESYVLVINEAPGDTERPYNALRLAVNLIARPHVRVRLFLLGDGVECARSSLPAHDNADRIQQMMKSLARRAEVAT